MGMEKYSHYNFIKLFENKHSKQYKHIIMSSLRCLARQLVRIPVSTTCQTSTRSLSMLTKTPSFNHVRKSIPSLSKVTTANLSTQTDKDMVKFLTEEISHEKEN